jgi:hypothetical protein
VSSRREASPRTLESAHAAGQRAERFDAVLERLHATRESPELDDQRHHEGAHDGDLSIGHEIEHRDTPENNQGVAADNGAEIAPILLAQRARTGPKGPHFRWSANGSVPVGEVALRPVRLYSKLHERVFHTRGYAPGGGIDFPACPRGNPDVLGDDRPLEPLAPLLANSLDDLGGQPTGTANRTAALGLTSPRLERSHRFPGALRDQVRLKLGHRSESPADRALGEASAGR